MINKAISHSYKSLKDRHKWKILEKKNARQNASKESQARLYESNS